MQTHIFMNLFLKSLVRRDKKNKKCFIYERRLGRFILKLRLKYFVRDFVCDVLDYDNTRVRAISNSDRRDMVVAGQSGNAQGATILGGCVNILFTCARHTYTRGSGGGGCPRKFLAILPARISN